MNLKDYLMYAQSAWSCTDFPQRKPERIQFPVNDVCNARCVMCNIWHQKKTHEITPEELRTALADPLFSDVHGVGLNGGEPTLRKDLPELAEVLIDTLPSLRSISLITNGLHRRRAGENIARLSKVCRARGTQLHVMVSMDGVDGLHDFVRGRVGNFANADGLIDDLLREGWADTLQMGCTVVRQNVYGIHELLDYAMRKGVYIKYRLGVPHRRLYKPAQDQPFTLGKVTWPDLHPFELDEEQTSHFAEFLLNLNKHYEPSLPQQWFYRSLVDQMLHGRPRQAGCAWRNAGVTLTSRGELAYCAVESDVLGNAIKTSASQLYWEQSGHLADIKRTKCASCHHDYGGMPEGVHLRRFARERLMSSPKARAALTWIKSTSAGQSLQQGREQQRAETEIRRIADAPSMPDTGATAGCTGLRKVIICGWYGTETAGDKAILGGVVQALRQAMGDIDVYLASLYPHISHVTVAQMPELGRLQVVPVETAAALVDQAALLVFGGGPLMAIPRMAVMVGLFERASRAGVRTLVAGCGVGPLGTETANDLIRRLLELSRIRIYRDDNSRQLAASLGVDVRHDVVAEDPAFTWLKNAHVRSATARAPGRLLLGLRDWPFKEYAAHMPADQAAAMKSMFDINMRTMLSDLLDELPGLTIAPVPMCANSYGGDDRFYHLATLCSDPKIHRALDMSLMGREMTPQGYVEEFRKASFAITMRFHALVFAAATQTPCVAIDYTVGKGKVGMLARRLAIPQHSLTDVDWPALRALVLDGMKGTVAAPSAGMKLSFTEALAQALAELPVGEMLQA